MKKIYKFSEMSRDHKREIVGQLGRKAAPKTSWEFVQKFPTEAASALANDVAIIISDRRVRAVVLGLKAGNALQPILIDDLSEGNEWVEGIHRSIAAQELGMKFVPVFVRIS
jgi:hypothetical protein